MRPLVSVLLPVYNGETYVRDAIESVLAQDYPNYEFIIVENASTDRTAEIIADYSDDRHIKVIHNEKTLPRLDNFAKAFAAAAVSSSWYKFIGDDDRLLPGCLREMVLAGEQHDNIGLVCSQYYNGDELVKGALPEDATVIRGAEILRKMLVDPEARSTIFSPTSVLICPDVYREMGGFRTDLLHADAELFYRILNKYDLAYVHKPLTCIGYHSSSGQAESTASGFTFTEAYLIRYHNLKFYGNVKLNWFEVEKIKYNLVNDSAGFMLGRMAKGDFKTAFGHLASIPLSALSHLPLSLIYFISLAVKKLIRREPIRLLTKERSGRGR
ncbi:MAG: glycosyltransferase [Firmicutes bacterium]|nr:glycosyltransferase [Bacillota bacterium]